MSAVNSTASVLPAGDTRRPPIGRAIVGTMIVTGLFELFALGSKEMRVLGDHAPWMDDPFDVVTSFAIFFLPIIGALSAVRLALCRSFEPLPVGRLASLIRGCVVLLAVAAIAAGSDWASVFVGADRGSWNQGTGLLVVALGALSVGLLLSSMDLIATVQRVPAVRGADPAEPDWLADATSLANRISRRAGPLRSGTTWMVTTADRSGWIRGHPIASAAGAAVVLAALFAAAALREGDPAPLLVFAFVVAWSGIFAFLVVAGRYLGLVAARAPIGTRRRLLDSTLVGCAAVPIALAFRDWLWALVGSSSSAAGLVDLDRLLILVATTGFLATFVLETLGHRHEPDADG